MSLEGQLLDQKSLRAITGKTADWNEIVKDCTAFAHATGGRLLLGIKDSQNTPPAGQYIPADLSDTLRRKLAERTVNVAVLPDVVTAPNGGQYIDLGTPRAMAVASITDNRYFFLRVADQSKPVTGDDVMRLASERSAQPWETQTTLQVPRAEINVAKRDKLLVALRASDRVKPSVKEKADDELLDHCQRAQRRRILKPEVIDFIAKADQTYQLTQRERITLGLLAQHDALTARELADTLELSSVEALQPWLKRLLDWHLVQSAGRTQAPRYFVDPGLLRSLKFAGETTLKRIEPHRFAALVLEDLKRYPEAAISKIHQRIAGEILTLEEVAAYLKAGKRTVYRLVQEGKIPAFKLGGSWRFRRAELDQWIATSIENPQKQGER